MRLINTKTRKLEDFHVPPKKYAILSHTWRDNEVLYSDFRSLDDAILGTTAGYAKIELLCAQALEDGLSHAWIDTVCIDKSSSAELSEAINLMFAWY